MTRKSKNRRRKIYRKELKVSWSRKAHKNNKIINEENKKQKDI